MKAKALKKPAAPKPRNAEKTKAAILAAAQQAFAEIGYSQAGIRDIAAIADVSSTLLLRYYGTKAALFEAALIEAMPLTPLLTTTKREAIGQHLSHLFIDTRLAIKPPSIIALATGDAEAREIATRVMQARILTPLARWLGAPDAEARALQIVTLAMGFVLFTQQFPLMPERKGADRKMASWLAASIQAVVDR